MNNPPAFPNDGLTCASEHTGGMTLRDYFAAKAMQGLLAGQSIADRRVFERQGITVLSDAAYKVADAMLAEREKGQP